MEAGIYTEVEAHAILTYTPMGRQLMSDLDSEVKAEAATQAELHGKSNSTPPPLRLLNAFLLQDARAAASQVASSPGEYTVPEVEAAMATLQTSQSQLDTELEGALSCYRSAFPADSLLDTHGLRARLKVRVAELSIHTARKNLEESVR